MAVISGATSGAGSKKGSATAAVETKEVICAAGFYR